MAIKNDSMSLVQKLLTTPSMGTQPQDPKQAGLTAKQTELVEKLIAHFSSPNFASKDSLGDNKSKNKAKIASPLSEWEKCSLLNREALVRNLKADKWDLAKSQARLEETIAWRRNCGCNEIGIAEQADAIKHEAQTGKTFTLGFDNLGRPIVHMRPRHQSSSSTPNRFPLSFWIIDRAIDLMPPGVETILFIIDLAGPQDSPSVRQQKDFVKTLGAHYCERLGQALVINMPTVFVWFLKLLKPVIDPVTFAKAVIDKADPLKFAPTEQLDTPAGGTNGYEFNIETYWPTVVAECMRRRQARLSHWIRAGKSIGSSELDDLGATQISSATSESSDLSSCGSATTDSAWETTHTSVYSQSQADVAHELKPHPLVAASQ